MATHSPGTSNPVNDPVEAKLIGDPNDKTNFQQAVRVGEHEKALAREEEGGNKGSRLDPAHKGDRAQPDPEIFGEPSRNEATAEDHKAFLDDNNIRTDQQAANETSRRPGAGESPGDEVSSPSKTPMNKPAKATENKAPPQGKTNPAKK